MRVYRYGLSALLNEDAMKLPSLLFSFQGRINQLPYWLVELVIYGIGSGSGQASHVALTTR